MPRHGADGWWPPPSKPIPVEGGLQARSQRGRIGDTWWSQRFIAVLESFGIGSRLQRGKRYARTGQVISMEIGPGKVTRLGPGLEGQALPGLRRDQGPHRSPSGTRSEDVMASSAVFMATLLAGDMPEEIEEAFAGSSAPLFPASARAISTSACSCPDWENPCKHIAAVYFLLAEAFDGDPFLIFAWRGRSKEELLAGLRARRRRADPTHDEAGTEPPEVTGAPDVGPFGWPSGHQDAALNEWPASAEEWWGRPAELAAIETRPRLAVAPDLLLRQLDPSALGAQAERVIDALRPLYEAITAGAADLVLDDEART